MHACLQQTCIPPFMKEAPGAVSGTIFDIDMPYFHHTGDGFALLFVGMLQFRMRFVHRRSETMPAALSNTARPADSIFFRLFSLLPHLLLVLFHRFHAICGFHATYDINKFPIEIIALNYIKAYFFSPHSVAFRKFAALSLEQTSIDESKN